MIQLTKAEVQSIREAHGFHTLDEMLVSRLATKRRALCTMNPDDPGFTTMYAKRQAEVSELQYLLGLLTPTASAE